MTMTVRYTNFNGQIVSENRGGTLHDYVPDALGSTVALLDSTQTQTDQWSYIPYGEVTRIKGTTDTKMLFVGTKGCRHDSSSRTLMGLRIMDTTLARFMTEDPRHFLSGNPNAYPYAADNPVRFIDPSGLAPCQAQPPPKKWPSSPPKKGPSGPAKKPKRKCFRGAFTGCIIAPDTPTRQSATFCNKYLAYAPTTKDDCGGCSPAKNCINVTDPTWIELVAPVGFSFHCYFQCAFKGQECDCY